MIDRLPFEAAAIVSLLLGALAGLAASYIVAAVTRWWLGARADAVRVVDQTRREASDE